jgi:hypothetical protein
MDAQAYRDAAERCLEAAARHPDDPNAPLFELWAREFLERAAQVEAEEGGGAPMREPDHH